LCLCLAYCYDSILGYAAYTAYTAALHFNPGVQAAYMAAHGGSAPDVQLVDVLFAGHALLLTLVTLWQCVIYREGSSSSPLSTSRTCKVTAAVVLAAVAAYSGHIGSTCGPSDCDAWLPMLYLLGFIKVCVAEEGRRGERGRRAGQGMTGCAAAETCATHARSPPTHTWPAHACPRRWR
jgi:cystinosin